jgi:hypothetical protein
MSPSPDQLTVRVDAARAIRARDVLADAWPLFQIAWPGSLPLALIGVAASGSPQATKVTGGEWWGVYMASALLMLICYGGVLLHQLALAEGRALRPFDALRLATRRLPQSAATAAILCAPLAFAVTLAGWNRGLAALVALPGLVLAVWLALAWPAALAEGLGPVAALRRGAALVRGQVLRVAGLVGAAFAAVLVFVLLTGILLGVVMSIAGMRGPTGSLQLGASRLLIAGLIAVPVVWLGAVWVTAYCRLRSASA